MQRMVVDPLDPAISGFVSRLNKAMDVLGVDDRGRPAWLAKKLGITVQGAQKYLYGHTYPKESRWEPLSKILGVNIQWIRDGTGPMKGHLDPLLAKFEAIWYALPADADREEIYQLAQDRLHRTKRQEEAQTKAKRLT